MRSKAVIAVGFLIRYGFTIADRSPRSSGIGTCHQEHVFFHLKVTKDTTHMTFTFPIFKEIYQKYCRQLCKKTERLGFEQGILTWSVSLKLFKAFIATPCCWILEFPHQALFNPWPSPLKELMVAWWWWWWYTGAGFTPPQWNLVSPPTKTSLWSLALHLKALKISLSVHAAILTPPKKAIFLKILPPTRHYSKF